MPKELLQEVPELGLSGELPNMTTVLRIFYSFHASVASDECTCYVLK
jgi:hypothetical protein